MTLCRPLRTKIWNQTRSWPMDLLHPLEYSPWRQISAYMINFHLTAYFCKTLLFPRLFCQYDVSYRTPDDSDPIWPITIWVWCWSLPSPVISITYTFGKSLVVSQIGSTLETKLPSEHETNYIMRCIKCMKNVSWTGSTIASAMT